MVDHDCSEICVELSELLKAMCSSGSSVLGAIQTQKSKKFIFFRVFLVMEDELK